MISASLLAQTPIARTPQQPHLDLHGHSIDPVLLSRVFRHCCSGWKITFKESPSLLPAPITGQRPDGLWFRVGLVSP